MISFNKFNKLKVIMLKMSFKLNITAENMLIMLISDEVNDFNVIRILNLIRLLLNLFF